jgi:hypothetical protein
MDFTINITGGVDCSAYPGDELSDAIPVGTLPYTHTWNSSYCYSNDNFVYASPDVYYLVTPSPQSAVIRASLCGSSFDTYISAYDNAGVLLAYNDDSPGCAPQSEINIPSQGEDSIYIIVEGWGLNSGYTMHNLQMFPNPADRSFVIREANGSQVTIFDVTGNAVLNIQNYQGEEISTGELAAGVYTVEVSGVAQTRNHKLVIAR